jgi:hypothetical protein
MRYPLAEDVKRLKILFLLCLLPLLAGCKKEIVEVEIDAFAKMDTEVKNSQGIYTILFTLQEYPYKEVGLRLGTDKAMFLKGTNLTSHTANQVSANRYGVFINALKPKQIYYFQIYVKDSATAKEVYSDVSSFTTNP